MTVPCPAPETLEGYLRQTLADEESDRLRPHVIACRACQAALGRLHYAAFGRDRRRRRRSKGAVLKWLRKTVPWDLVVLALMAAILAAGATGLFLLAMKKQ